MAYANKLKKMLWAVAGLAATAPAANAAVIYQKASLMSATYSNINVAWTQTLSDVYTDFGLGSASGGPYSYNVLASADMGVATKTITFPFMVDGHNITGATVGGADWSLVARARNAYGNTSGVSNELHAHRVRHVDAEAKAGNVISWKAYGDLGEKLGSGAGALTAGHKIVAAVPDPAGNTAWIVTQGINSSGSADIVISRYNVETGSAVSSTKYPNLPSDLQIISAKTGYANNTLRVFMKFADGRASQWIIGIKSAMGSKCPDSGAPTDDCYAPLPAVTIPPKSTFTAYKGNMTTGDAPVTMTPIAGSDGHVLYSAELPVDGSSTKLHLLKVVTLDPVNGKIGGAAYPTNQYGQVIAGITKPVDIGSVPSSIAGNFGIAAVNSANITGSYEVLYPDIGYGPSTNILRFGNATNSVILNSDGNPYLTFNGNLRLPPVRLAYAGGTRQVVSLDGNGNMEVCQFDQTNARISLSAGPTDEFPTQANTGFCYLPEPGTSTLVQNGKKLPQQPSREQGRDEAVAIAPTVPATAKDGWIKKWGNKMLGKLAA